MWKLGSIKVNHLYRRGLHPRPLSNLRCILRSLTDQSQDFEFLPTAVGNCALKDATKIVDRVAARSTPPPRTTGRRARGTTQYAIGSSPFSGVPPMNGRWPEVV
jgi:hypothetical protein